ncbi:MAG: hypothetical protein GQ535_01075 [Rhodobacteraceae bacterium]|nr:hypothetical protein [Paracoccaceae bacterium]
MVETLDLHPLRAEVVEDHYNLSVAFLFPSPRPALDFQICKTPSEQDVQLGMDSVYLEHTETGIGGYDIIENLRVVAGLSIGFSLNTKGQKLLSLPENVSMHFGRLKNAHALEKALKMVASHHG